MSIKVRLKDTTKIAWDRETGTVITGANPVEVEETQFIRQKIREGVLVKVETTIKEPIKVEAPKPSVNPKKTKSK